MDIVVLGKLDICDMKAFKLLYFCCRSDRDQVALWSEAYGVLTTALEISQASVSREANLEAEILFNLG